jgi:2-phospho-L-lactate guanylyltransferase
LCPSVHPESATATGSTAARAAGQRRHETIYGVRWRVLLPIKRLHESKTRLAGATHLPSDHPDLVRALQLDTLAAVSTAQKMESASIVGIYVISDEPPSPLPDGVTVLADFGGGLNGALAAAAAELVARFPTDGVAGMVADLPAMRPAELLGALALATDHPRAFVPDRTGTGTTMLTAAPGRDLRPMFGAGSAHRHRESGAVALEAGPSLRTDVDTVADLQRCLVLGVGERTASMVAHLV